MKYILFLIIFLFSNSLYSQELNILTRYNKDRIISIQKTIKIPPNANKLKHKIILETNKYFGLANKFSTTFFAQIYQESKFNPNAKSKYAAGLTQFTPDTAKEITARYRNILKIVDPLNEDWAISALLLYMRELIGSCKGFLTNKENICDITACALASYNGGFGWIKRDQLLTNNKVKRYWDSIELYSRRNPEFKKENREYPVRILYVHAPVFKSNSFGESLICD